MSILRPYKPFSVIQHCLGPTSLISGVRKYSTHSDADIGLAKEWLLSFHHDSIPKNVFEISYSRSSGPGGQKVNKTSSKATISLQSYQWLNPKTCQWIPDAIRAQLSENGFRYQTKSGGILIQSDTFRCRDANTEECFRRLLAEIKNLVEFEGETSQEDKEKWEKLAKVRKERQMENKKRQSEKRKMRSQKFDY